MIFSGKTDRYNLSRAAALVVCVHGKIIPTSEWDAIQGRRSTPDTTGAWRLLSIVERHVL